MWLDMMMSVYQRASSQRRMLRAGVSLSTPIMGRAVQAVEEDGRSAFLIMKCREMQLCCQ
jgi:hypothetical protein